MNKLVLAAFWILVICISGCAQTLPPHEGLNQAFKNSFDATGFNYISESRVTNFTLSKNNALAESNDKRLKNLGFGVDIIKSITMKTDGVVDMKSKRSEAIYELHYKKDNVDVSIKIPLLLDYNSKTIYLGESFINTFIEIAYPQLLPVKNSLLRLNINELMQEDQANYDKLTAVLGKDRFSAKNIELINNAFKTGVLKSIAKLESRSLSELPLTDQDKKNGIDRKIHVVLEHKDSVPLIHNLIDTVFLALFQDGIVSKDEYAILLTLTDKEKLNAFLNEFSLTMTFDAGISKTGFVSLLDSQINFGDKDGVFLLGLSNVSTFSNYNLPQFSIIPEKRNIVEFKQVLDAIKTDSAKTKEKSQPKDKAPEASENVTEPNP